MAKPALAFRNKVEQAHPGATVQARWKTGIEFRLPDGKSHLEVGLGPIHKADNTTEIDTDWTATTGAWQWEMTGDDYQAFSRDTLGVGTMYRFQIGAEFVEFQPLALNWVNDQDSRQQITQPQSVVGTVVGGDSLRFANGYGAGRHFEYQTQPGRLQKRLTLDSNNLPTPTVTGAASLEIEFIISKSAGVTEWVDGVQWDRSTRVGTPNHIEYRTSQGVVLWAIELPRMWDSGNTTTIGTLVLRRQGANRLVTARWPKTVIDAATFPLTLDPSITNQAVGASADDATEGSTGVVTLTDTSSPNQLDATTEWHGARWDISGSSIGTGATINSCTVTCEFPNNALDEPFVTMFFEETAAPAAFTTGSNDISNRARTTASVTWNNADLGSTGAGIGGGDDFTSPDLTTPLQEVVDSQGTLTKIAWIVQGGGGGGTRDFSVTCYDGSTTKAPRLSVTWTMGGVSSVGPLIGGKLANHTHLFGILV